MFDVIRGVKHGEKISSRTIDAILAIITAAVANRIQLTLSEAIHIFTELTMFSLFQCVDPKESDKYFNAVTVTLKEEIAKYLETLSTRLGLDIDTHNDPQGTAQQMIDIYPAWLQHLADAYPEMEGKPEPLWTQQATAKVQENILHILYDNRNIDGSALMPVVFNQLQYLIAECGPKRRT